MKHLKTCSFCKKKVYRIAARGLCANCYYREQRNGTPAYQDRSPKPCSVDGCDAIAIAKGYCDKHYRLYRRHGTPSPPNHDLWGHAEHHPLHHTHNWIKKRAAKRGMHESWKDFWTFVRDVGERPSAQHRLERIRECEPIGPKNFRWAERKINLPASSREERNAYARAYRALNPRRAKSSDLKKMYGITIELYEQVLAKQGGGCAICGRKENGKRYSHFAVDHCHKSKKIRGLLCSDCNRGLGFFADSIERLKSAVRYLRRSGSC